MWSQQAVTPTSSTKTSQTNSISTFVSLYIIDVFRHALFALSPIVDLSLIHLYNLFVLNNVAYLALFFHFRLILF
jgi:hypothetical protein